MFWPCRFFEGESALDIIEIEITNWSKHNPRKDFKRPVWFALSNRILEDPSLFDLSDGELRAWIYILCQASQKNSSIVKLNVSHADRVCRVSRKVLESAIEKLVKAECIQHHVRGTNARRTSSVRHTTEQYTTEQYTTEQNRTEDSTDLDADAPSNGASIGQLSHGFAEHKENPILVALVGPVSLKVQASWLAAYQDAGWIVGEVLKANAWIEANPKKRPKQFGKFMTNWLSRGWEMHRRGIQSVRQTHAEVIGDSLDRLEKKWREKGK